MDELIQGLVAKVGLDEETAKKVFTFLQENADSIPSWLTSSDLAKGVMDKIPGGLGGLLGGN